MAFASKFLFILFFISSSYSQEILKIPTTKKPSQYYFWVGCSEGYIFSSKSLKTNCHFAAEKNIVRNFVNLLSVGGSVQANNLIGSDNINFSMEGYLSVFSIVQAGLRYTPDQNKPKFMTGVRIPIVPNKNAHLNVKYIPADKQVEVGMSINLNRKKSHINREFIDFSINKDSSNSNYSDIVDNIKEIDYSNHLPDQDNINQLENSISSIFEIKTPNLKLEFKDQKQHDMEEVKNKFISYHDKFYSNNKSYEDYVNQLHSTTLAGFKKILEETNEDFTILNAIARFSLLNHLIAPFNKSFSQEKVGHKDRDLDIKMLIQKTNDVFFKATIAKFPNITDERLTAAIAYFNQIIMLIKKGIDTTNQRWGNDSRLVWIPMNIGLNLSESSDPMIYKEFFEKVTGVLFTKNKVSHLVSESWYEEYIRSIKETESFHGLLIHDIQGSNVMKGGKTDDVVSWKVALLGYANTQVENLSKLARGKISIESFPKYYIFLDSFYYSNTKPFKVFKFLENIGDLSVATEIAETITQGNSQSDIEFPLITNLLSYAQKIQEAINSNPVLKKYSKEDIKKLLKININITFAYDTALFKQNFMTDHRKLFFRDLIEENPKQALAVFGGMGFGELYAGPQWEDRGIKIQGPAALAVKDEINTIFERHGIDEKSKGFRDFFVPKPKRIRNLLDSTYRSEVAITFNRFDYEKKITSVGRAYQFDMMEKGGVLVIPDSLWLSDYWQNMLISAAHRGVKTYILVNATKNIVSPFIAVLQRAREVFLKFFYISKLIEKNTGENNLRVGINNSQIPVGETLKRFEKITENLNSIPGIDEILDKEELINAFDKVKGEVTSKPKYVFQNDTMKIKRPFMHLKMNLYLSPKALTKLKEIDLTELFENYIVIRVKQANKEVKNYDGITLGNLKKGIYLDRMNMIDGIASYKIGSHNMDNRSHFIDAEVGVFSIGESTLLPLTDIYALLGLSLWPKDYNTINEFLEYTDWKGELLSKIMKGFL